MDTKSTQSDPSYLKMGSGSSAIPIANWPLVDAPPADTDAAKVATEFIASINSALSSSDLAAVAGHFLEQDGYWRDHMTMSWAFRSLSTRAGIRDFLSNDASRTRDGFRLRSFAVDDSTPLRAPQFAQMDVSGQVKSVQFAVRVETAIGRGEGMARLVLQGGEWKIFTLYTKLDELRGHEERTRRSRPLGVEHGCEPGRQSWGERRRAMRSFDKANQPDVVILGAGQGGLAVAARLKMLGVDALIVERNARVGDNWRQRYHQLVLHDPVWYDHMPYMPFPEGWPVFTPKDQVAQFLEAYAMALDLHVWTSTELQTSSFDETTGRWILTLKRASGYDTRSETLRPKHVVQATSLFGIKSMPNIDGYDSFTGDFIGHSSEFPGAREESGKAGKKAVVVGSSNSAMDVAQDFAEKGYDVTMVQRSSTYVVSSKTVTNFMIGSLYCEDGPAIEDADLMGQSLPTTVVKAIQIPLTQILARLDGELLKGLEQAGFQTDLGLQGTGMTMKALERGGGYYIDVGASRLIADGRIRVKSGRGVAAVLPHSVRLEGDDDEELYADEIVFATGFQNAKTRTHALFGDEMAAKVSPVWGLNSEGELRTVWQRSGHPGFWLMGGNFAFSRYFSKILALQIKAQLEGIYADGEA